MPFQKGNKLGVIGAKVRKDKLDNLFAWVASGGAREYHELLASLPKHDDGLSKGKTEFLDRYAPLIEYAKPKLARKEIVGDGGGPLKVMLLD